MPMSTIQTTTGGREFDRNFGPGQLITDLSELQMTALVASAMAVFVEGEATALPASGQIPITSVQFRYPAQFGFQAVNGRLFLFEGIEYAGDGSGLVRVTPLPGGGGSGGSGGGDASAENQATQITLAGTTNTRLGAPDEAAPASDTAPSALNGRLQRIAQRISTLIADIGTLISGVTGISAKLPATLESGRMRVQSVEGLSIPKHDYVAMTYTGDDLTSVVYKTGGSGGTTVATVTLTYSGGKLATVTRS